MFAHYLAICLVKLLRSSASLSRERRTTHVQVMLLFAYTSLGVGSWVFVVLLCLCRQPLKEP